MREGFLWFSRASARRFRQTRREARVLATRVPPLTPDMVLQLYNAPAELLKIPALAHGIQHLLRALVRKLLRIIRRIRARSLRYPRQHRALLVGKFQIGRASCRERV